MSIPSELKPAWIRSDIRLPVKKMTMPRVEIGENDVVFNFNVESIIRVLQEEAYTVKMSSPTVKFPFRIFLYHYLFA